MRKCKTCSESFEPNPSERRKQIYCDSECRRVAYDRVPNSTLGQKINCARIRCGKTFAKTKNHQRFCSPECYKGAWIEENRSAHNARIAKRRANNPEWYAEREPLYSATTRKNTLEKRPWRYVFCSRRSDARIRNIIFTLTDEWCAARWTGKCELTGVSFRANPAGRGPFPFSCSLDKIKPELGYTPENCRFILWGCNGLKGSGTDEDMYAIAKALMAGRRD